MPASAFDADTLAGITRSSEEGRSLTTKARKSEPMSATLDDADAPGSGERDVAADPEREIALRTGDTSEHRTPRFQRVFLIPGTAAYVEPDEALHRRNGLAVLEQAIQQGLHPTSKAVLDSAEDYAGIGHDPRYPHVRLTYSVDVTPAGIHADAAETWTPGRVLREEMSGSTENDK